MATGGAIAQELRVNERIRAREVRLVAPDGSQIVAAVSDGGDPAAWDLVVFDTAAPGQGTSLGVSCTSPSWVAARPE